MNEITKECPTCGSIPIYSLRDLAEGVFIPGVSNRSNVQAEISIYLGLDEEEKRSSRGKYYCPFCKQFHQLALGVPENELYAQAYEFWQNHDFESATDVYTSIIAQDDIAHRAYWYRALCRNHISEDKHGLYYIDRPGMLFTDDADYHKTMDCTIGYTESEQYLKLAKSLELIYNDYLDLEQEGKKIHICICQTASDKYNVTADKLISLLQKEREDLEIFRFSLSNSLDNSEADICYAINKAKVLIILGDEMAGVVRSRFWKPFMLKIERNPSDFFRVLRISDVNTIIPDELTCQNINPDDILDDDVGVLKYINQVYEPVQKQQIITETHVHTTIVTDPHTKEKLDLAYQSFLKSDFVTAQKGAIAVLQNSPDNIIAKYILSFYQSYVENTSNRNAIHKFFNETEGMGMCAADTKQMKSLFAFSAPKILAFEEQVINLLMRSEIEKREISAFADVFCAKIITLQKDIEFLTLSKIDLYCELARNGSLKMPIALLSIIKTNPASPVVGNKFYLTGRAEAFRNNYLIPIGRIMNSIGNSEARAKLNAVYKNELNKYEQQMRH